MITKKKKKTRRAFICLFTYSAVNLPAESLSFVHRRCVIVGSIVFLWLWKVGRKRIKLHHQQDNIHNGKWVIASVNWRHNLNSINDEIIFFFFHFSFTFHTKNFFCIRFYDETESDVHSAKNICTLNRQMRHFISSVIKRLNAIKIN